MQMLASVTTLGWFNLCWLLCLFQTWSTWLPSSLSPTLLSGCTLQGILYLLWLCKYHVLCIWDDTFIFREILTGTSLSSENWMLCQNPTNPPPPSFYRYNESRAYIKIHAHPRLVSTRHCISSPSTADPTLAHTPYKVRMEQLHTASSGLIDQAMTQAQVSRPSALSYGGWRL